MSIGVDIHILSQLEKHLDDLKAPIAAETLSGVMQKWSYPYNVGYLKAIKDMEDTISDMRQKLLE